jgi:glycosyltransferase involved in cell wall biosynthesis
MRSLCRYKTFIVTPSIFFQLVKRIRSFDIIHVHDARSFQGIATCFLAKLLKVPYVFQPHGSFLSNPPNSRLERMARLALDKIVSTNLVKNASKIVALSEAETHQYEEAGIPRERISIVPNGIDLSLYTRLPPKGSFKRKFNVSGDKKIILYLGRIHKTKGIELLIKACALLAKDGRAKDSVLVLLGPDDGFMAKAKSLVNSLGISDSVLLTGFVGNEDKMMALVDASLFVTPSFYGFPVTFLEACAVGKPIVTTTLGDTLDWIDNNVGYATSPEPGDLAKAMCAIVSDPDLSRRFSSNCRRLVESRFSLEKTVAKLERLYETAGKCANQ